MPAHLKENFLIHMSLLATSHAKLSTNYHSLQTEHSKLNNQVVAEVAELRVENQSLKEQIKRLQNDLGACLQFGPVTLTMTNFEQHKKDGDKWYSPPVYSHYQGYKLCLRVDTNGSGDGKGTHVSVFVYFMKGEFDDSLKWPFRGVISFRLLDQLKVEDHQSHVITYNDRASDGCCSRVIKGEKSEGWVLLS